VTPSYTRVGSGPTSVSNSADSELIGSNDTTAVSVPERACATAVAAAQVVVPTAAPPA
jgi:hypothetical protein